MKEMICQEKWGKKKETKIKHGPKMINFRALKSESGPDPYNILSLDYYRKALRD